MSEITLSQKRWLFDWMEKEKHLMAAADSDNDKIFKQLEEAGAVKQYDSMFGNRYYALTDQGRKALRP